MNMKIQLGEIFTINKFTDLFMIDAKLHRTPN